MDYLAADVQRIKDALPDTVSVPDDADDLFLIYAVLLRVKGAATTAADVHDAWSAWQAARDPNHESIVPYDRLDADVQKEDEPFAAAIRRCASETDQRL